MPTSHPRPRAGAELNQEKRTCTFRPLAEEDSCRLVLSAVGARPRVPGQQVTVGSRVALGDRRLCTPQVCLGERAKEEVNRVEILPAAAQEDRRTPAVTIATLKASVLPMVSSAGARPRSGRPRAPRAQPRWTKIHLAPQHAFARAEPVTVGKSRPLPVSCKLCPTGDRGAAADLRTVVYPEIPCFQSFILESIRG